MKKIDIMNTVLRDSFYLSDYKVVNSFNDAKLYGGATLVNNQIISNIQGTNDITVKDNTNTLQIIIPSTIEADTIATDFEEYVEYIEQLIKAKYQVKTIKNYSQGSWYSEELNKVIIEDNCIIEVRVKDITIDDITFMHNLGLKVKEDRTQEAVSILFNNSLAII